MCFVPLRLKVGPNDGRFTRGDVSRQDAADFALREKNGLTKKLG